MWPRLPAISVIGRLAGPKRDSALSFFIRAFVVVGPLLLLGSWGVSYLRQCLNVLSAPGTPIELPFRTSLGIATFRASSYTISPARGIAIIDRPRLYDPDGTLVASADQIAVTGLDLARGADQAPQISVDGLHGRIRRLHDGKFQLEYLIPKRNGRATQIPYFVSVEGADFDLVDEVGPKPFLIHATCDRVRLAGVGDEWAASARVSIEGAGQVAAVVHSDAVTGYEIDCQTPGLELAPLIRHVEEIPQGKRLAREHVRADSARVSGPISVLVAHDGSVTFQSQAAVRLARLVAGDYAAERVAFSGLITQGGVAGHADFSEGRTNGTFDGSAVWGKVVEVAGHFQASCPGGISDLPSFASKKLPKRVDFRHAQATGWLSYREGGKYEVSGDLAADAVELQKQQLASVQTHFALGQGRLQARVESASWHGQTISGGLELTLASRHVQGGLSAPTIDLGAVAQQFGHGEWSGAGSADVLVGGTQDNPEASFQAFGRALYATKAAHVDPLLFEASGSYANGSLSILRADATGRDGDAFLQGVLHADRAIDFQVVGRQVQLANLFPNVKGQMNLEASVKGTMDHPIATGRAEAYALTLGDHDLPLVTTDFRANRERANFYNSRAIQGSSEADASGTYFLASRHLTAQGKVTGVQIGEYLGSRAVGAVDVPQFDVVGSLRSPLITADVSGDSIVLDGVKVDHLQFHASADRNGVRVDTAQASLAGGQVTATGAYDFESREANVQATASPLDLAALSDALMPDTNVAGTVSGIASLTMVGADIQSATGTGKLANVTVGGTVFGDGPWTIFGKGKTLSGSLAVGHLDRFVELHNLVFNYEPKEPTLSGSADVYNLQINDIINTGSPYIIGVPDDLMSQLGTLQGALNASVQFEGELSDPTLNVTEFDAEGLTLGGEPVGNLVAKFGRRDRLWTIDSSRLSLGQGSLTVDGTFAEDGDMKLEGDLSGLSLSRLAFLDSRLAGAAGVLNASFATRGKTHSPTIQASVSANGLLQEPGEKDEDRSLRVELAPITVTPSESSPNGGLTGGIQVAGSYFYRGFLGQITAALPFAYPLHIPDDQPIQARLTVADRDLKEIAPFLSGLDAARTKGSVGGSISLSGSTKQPVLNGAVVATADALAFEGGDGVFHNVQAHVGVQNDKLTLQASGDGSLGGSLTASISSPIGDLGAVLAKASSNGFRSLLENPLTGDLSLDNLKLRQALADRAYIAATLSGDVSITGSLRRPNVAGAINIFDLDSRVPSLGTSELQQPDLPVDPRFDVTMELANTAHVQASAAELYLTGGGAIKGSLSEPQVDAKLTVEKGNVSLPAATVRIQDGGTVDLVYHRAADQTISRLDVDLTGSTQVVGPGANDTIQNFDVTLGVHGDLLASDAGLNLTASAQPPYLNQDQILGLLGEAPALQSMNSGSGVSRSEAQRQIQSALAGFALPSVTGSFTSSIARSLELDYLQFSYNPYQNAVVSFAKALGRDFTFQGTTGLGQPPPGYPFQYDYRLVIHPRTLRGILSNFSLFLGSDQYSYYKVGLLYGVRFW